MRVKHRAGWIVPWLAVATLGAAGREVPLIDAVKAADTAAVRALLEQQVDVNTSEVDSTTALHWAAYKGDLDAAQLLLAAGATVDAPNRYDVTPLALACGRGNAPIVEALLNAGADANTTLPEGETVLMAAARSGNVDVLRLLLAHGADLSARESWRGQTALMWAAAENHPAAVHTLVELGADVNERSPAGWSSLLFAARAGNLEAVSALVEAGADVNDTIQPVDPEPEPQETERASYRRRARPEGTSALVIAVTNAHFSLAKYLVERGADLNAAEQGWTALHQLAYTRRPNSGKGMPPVQRVDPLDTLELATFFLENGADPNLRQTKRFRNRERNNLNRVGATPYLLAAKHADVPLMRLLAANGADTRQPTEENASPVMVAAGVGLFNLGESAGTNEEAFGAVQLAYDLGRPEREWRRRERLYRAAWRSAQGREPYRGVPGRQGCRHLLPREDERRMDAVTDCRRRALHRHRQAGGPHGRAAASTHEGVWCL